MPSKTGMSELVYHSRGLFGLKCLLYKLEYMMLQLICINNNLYISSKHPSQDFYSTTVYWVCSECVLFSHYP